MWQSYIQYSKDGVNTIMDDNQTGVIVIGIACATLITVASIWSYTCISGGC